MKSFLDENKGILFVISISFLVSFLSLNRNIWWDSAVYIGIGKFLYSFGQSGFLEPSRPLIWPLFLGAAWKIGSVVVFGKILGLLFGAGCVYLTYLIGKEIFNKKVALVSALFLAFTPVFLFFNAKMLSDVPSLFFILLSIYFFVNKKYFLTGLFAGTAFLTRFLELILFFAIVILFWIYLRKEKDFLKNLSNIFIGFLLMIVPYLLFNYFMYQNVFYSFDLQLFLTKETGWMYHQPFWFYFVNLFMENVLFVFALFGIALIFKCQKYSAIHYGKRNISEHAQETPVSDERFLTKPDYKKFTILFSFLTFFAFFSFIAHKEVRFILLFLPYLCILSSYGIFGVFNRIKSKKIIFSFFLLLFFVWFLQTAYQVRDNYDREVGQYDVFQNYLGREAKGNIWISNPAFAVYSDKKIDELVYYPTFNHDKFVFLRDNLENAEHVLLNTCDLYCEPYNEFCKGDKIELISLLKSDFDEVFYNKENGCEDYIFRK